MIFNPNLGYGENLTNKQMYQLFKCSNAGGMRRSKKTNTLVLISDIQNHFMKTDGKMTSYYTLVWV